MIDSVSIKNFGCLRDVTMDLGPITVLVGPNDAGKSMLLKALQALATSCASPEGWQSIGRDAAELKALTFNQRGGPLELDVRGKTLDASFRYQVAVESRPSIQVDRERLEVDGTAITRVDERTVRVEEYSMVSARFGPQGQFLARAGIERYADEPSTDRVLEFLRSRAVPVAASLRRMRRHLLRPERLLDRTPLPAELRRPMDPDGLELAAACADLLLANTGDFEKIEEALCDAMPHVAGIQLQRSARSSTSEDKSRDEYLLHVRTKAGARIPGHLVSDGVLLFLAYLVLLNWPEPPSVLMIEEPETGLHPGLMSRLVRMLEGAAAGGLGTPPVQILVTTQSPDFLNYVRPEDIRVVRRGEDGATEVVPFRSAPDLRRLLEYQSPGEIWVNLGEDTIAGRGGA